mmetsp:Transcript_14712/g.40934  ORF Transcript_14712/g.40934 Transcript_14712/m.40934 type:complete len:110 (-) Transcript_14712:35-364(-)
MRPESFVEDITGNLAGMVSVGNSLPIHDPSRIRWCLSRYRRCGAEQAKEGEPVKALLQCQSEDDTGDKKHRSLGNNSFRPSDDHRSRTTRSPDLLSKYSIGYISWVIHH